MIFRDNNTLPDEGEDILFRLKDSGYWHIGYYSGEKFCTSFDFCYYVPNVDRWCYLEDLNTID